MASGFCTFPVMTGEPSQGSRRRVRLLQRFPFAAVRAFNVLHRTDPHSAFEIDADHIRHLSALKSAPRLEASQ